MGLSSVCVSFLPIFSFIFVSPPTLVFIGVGLSEGFRMDLCRIIVPAIGLLPPTAPEWMFSFIGACWSMGKGAIVC